MQTAQRPASFSLIRRLIEQPYRFEFVQAVRIIDACLGQGVEADGQDRYLRFRNRLSLAFPPSQITALELQSRSSATCDAELAEAASTGTIKVALTPSFGGLLGASGVLPNHYTEMLLSAQGDGAHAFFDMVAHRAQALHYRAWTAARIYYQRNRDGSDRVSQIQLSLAGVCLAQHPSHPAHPFEPDEQSKGGMPAAGRFDADLPAYYAVVLRHPTTPAQVLENVLADHFGVPFKVQSFVGTWQLLAPAEQACLGATGGPLGNVLLGPRYYDKSHTVRVRIGPLALDDYERFLPRRDGARALARVVSMFRLAALRIEAQPVLRAQDSGPAKLIDVQRPGRALGHGALLFGGPEQDCDGPIYVLPHGGNDGKGNEWTC